MEQNTCGDCRTTKDLDRFTGKNITCNACLEKGRRWRVKNPDNAHYYEDYAQEILARNREYRKTYNLIEVDCEVCECKVKKCRWSKHILTKKQLDTLEAKSWNRDKLSLNIFFEIVENVFLKIHVWNVWWGGQDGLEHGIIRPLLIYHTRILWHTGSIGFHRGFLATNQIPSTCRCMQPALCHLAISRNA